MMRAMRRAGLLVGLAVVLCCAVVLEPWLFDGGSQQQPIGEPSLEPVPPQVGGGAEPVVAAGPETGARESQDSLAGGMLELPDGSRVPALNGVKAPAALVWGDAPWSPIVGTTRSEGVDWFVHEDGTYSTTVEVFRSDLGRTDPVTLVSRAGTPVPVEGVVPPKKATGSAPSRR